MTVVGILKCVNFMSEEAWNFILDTKGLADRMTATFYLIPLTVT